jgi:hypothetical protein
VPTSGAVWAADTDAAHLPHSRGPGRRRSSRSPPNRPATRAGRARRRAWSRPSRSGAPRGAPPPTPAPPPTARASGGGCPCGVGTAPRRGGSAAVRGRWRRRGRSGRWGSRPGPLAAAQEVVRDRHRHRGEWLTTQPIEILPPAN